MKNKKKLLLCIFCAITGFGVWHIQQDHTLYQEPKEVWTEYKYSKQEINKRIPSSKELERKKIPHIIKKQDQAKKVVLKKKDWEKVLAASILRFQPKEDQIYIKKVKTHKDSNTGKVTEEVQIIHQQSKGMRYSYKALVNPITGAILTTWAKTRYETLAKHQKVFSAHPMQME